MKALYFALMANFSFALGSIFFTHYTQKMGSMWMNTFKALVGLVGFFISILIVGGFHEVTDKSLVLFGVSGFIGLGLGDYFLLRAFAKIGPGRSMVLFGFHPVVVGVISYLIFNQVLPSDQKIGIAFFIGCLITFSIESFKVNKKWELSGIIFAGIGMLLDAIGVIITRAAFDDSVAVGGFEGNFYRCFGAVVFYFIISRVKPFHLIKGVKSLSSKSVTMVTTGAILGTFLSLALYLNAIKTAENLATITAVSITSVLFATTFECIWHKKMPNRYLWIGLVFFSLGMKFVLL